MIAVDQIRLPGTGAVCVFNDSQFSAADARWIASGQMQSHAVVTTTREGEWTAFRVRCEPGTRSKWHRHPGGQLLLVTKGHCEFQRRSQTVEQAPAGSLVYFPPDESHWHGATATEEMEYLSVQPLIGGVAAHWEA